MSKPIWFPDWTGQTVAIVAGGPSVAEDQVKSLQGRCRVIAVNRAMFLAPWADVAYAADARWWETYPECREFLGLKIVADENIPRVYPQIYPIETVSYSDDGPIATQFVLDRPGVIAHGGNSGHQAVNLALQFGARKIILLGFDFFGGHWHDPHPLPLRNPKETSLNKWRDRLDSMSKFLQENGIEVIVVSSRSALKNYTKVDTVDEALRITDGDRDGEGRSGRSGEVGGGSESRPEPEGPEEVRGDPVPDRAGAEVGLADAAAPGGS